jgi:CheY-like chemotaxis protein
MGARGRHRAAWEPTASRPRPNLEGLKVVVVDDDEDSADYFALALRAYGAVVAIAYNAIDGLRLVQEHQPDVVLSDIAMMGQDGYWLVREIRRLSSDALSQVPVVATTAYGREHSRQRTLAAGFTEHLAKPVDPDLLRQTIGGVAGR